MATLIHFRHDLPHAALGLVFGVDRSTVTRAIGELPSPAARSSVRFATWRRGRTPASVARLRARHRHSSKRIAVEHVSPVVIRQWP